MPKLMSLSAAFLLATVYGAAAQAPATSTTGSNQPAPTSAKDPSGNVGRPGASSSSTNTPASGEPTGTSTPQADKNPDTRDNTASAPRSR